MDLGAFAVRAEVPFWLRLRRVRVEGAREIRGCKSVRGSGPPRLPAERATRFESSEASHRQNLLIFARNFLYLGENFYVRNPRRRRRLCKARKRESAKKAGIGIEPLSFAGKAPLYLVESGE